ncbi:hypothetical protein TomTYG45_11080 [Sphingobium sp. TomTYG45]
MRNDHLDGSPLLIAKTAGSTPFRLSTHVGDVGHMMVVGPTGAGKSVLLSLIAIQFRRYRQAQVYIFDKGNSARAAVLAMGGAHHALGSAETVGGELAFQPLAGIEDHIERSWAAEWIAALLAHENVPVTPEVKEAVWTALGSLASAPREERTMTGVALLLQSNALRTALQPYTLEGPHGRLAALNFDYAISGDRSRWRPLRAFDDGRQTFIEFPPALAQGDAPPLFLLGPDGKAELVNYRLRERYYIVDRLFSVAELRLGLKKQEVVRITRIENHKRRRGA